MKQYFGTYVGIVIQNNDPEKRGRVKVFVPHISPTVYDNWVASAEDKKFGFLGKNVNSSLNNIYEDLKKILPWAEVAAPLIAEGGSGRYHANSNIGSISDTNLLSTFTPATSGAGTPGGANVNTQNIDEIGEKPGNIYESPNGRLNDAFADPKKYNLNRVNEFSYNYVPSTYSNRAKGSFGVLNVGAHVYVNFLEGDPLRPICFASAYGSDDWKYIYDSFNDSGEVSPGQDYPGVFENTKLSGGQIDINTATYRNKYVINQKGGAIEFVNTDNREILKLTHYSGSFKEFNNFTNTELAVNNDQKLVQRDQYTTINGFNNLYVGRDYDMVVNGDHYRKIGNLDYKAHVQWKEIFREVADYKQLFEVKRCEAYKKGLINFTSPLQSKDGGKSKHGPCPVCVGNRTLYYKLNNKFQKATTGSATSGGNSPWSLNGLVSILPFGKSGVKEAQPGFYGDKGKIFGETCPACGGDGKSPSSQGGNFSKDTRKDRINDLIKSKMQEILKIEENLGLGGNEIINITKHKIETIGMDINDFPSIRVDKIGKISVNEVVVHKEGVFNNQRPSPLVEYVHVDDLPGGTYTLTVGNRFNVLVGAGGINFKSYGPVNISGSITNVVGHQVNISSENEVNIDGGQRLSLVADILSLRQRNNQQVVVDSNLGVTCNAVIGGSLHVEGELYVNHLTGPVEVQETEKTIVSGMSNPNPMLPKKIGYLGKKIATPGGFSLGGGGGAGGDSGFIGYAEIKPMEITSIGIAFCGEGPCFITVRGPLIPYYPPVYGSSTGKIGGLPPTIYTSTMVGQRPDPDCIVNYAHSHTFKNIPLRLTKENDETRKAAKLINNATGERTPASGISNMKKLG